jgi:hypothetical protein
MRNTEEKARDLFAVLNQRPSIAEIIETQAWEQLGYGSFTEAWSAEVGDDITHPAEVLTHVAYQMLAEGRHVAVITELVKGIGMDRVQALKRQRDHGVPAEDASLSARAGFRTIPTTRDGE